MAYKKGIPLTGGLYPMDNGDFPLVEAADVYVNDNSRLSDKLSAQDAAISAKYIKPAGGIPASDMAENVQDSLDAAAGVVDEVSDLKSAISEVTILNLFADTTYKSYKKDCFDFLLALYIPAATYKGNLRMSVLRRNDSGTWQVRFYAYIEQTLTLIYDFTTTTNPEKDGNQFLTINPASGVDTPAAYAIVDWSKLPANYSMTGKTGDEMILANEVYDGTQVSIFLPLQPSNEKRFGSLEDCLSQVYDGGFQLFNNNNYNVYTKAFAKVIKYLYIPDTTYKNNLRIAALERNNSGTWKIRFYTYISGTLTLIYDYLTTTNPEVGGLQFVEIPNVNNPNSMKAVCLIDWTQVDSGYSMAGRTEDYMIVSNDCYESDAIRAIMLFCSELSSNIDTVKNKVRNTIYNYDFKLFNNNNYNTYTQTVSKVIKYLYVPRTVVKNNLRVCVIKRNNGGVWQLRLYAIISSTLVLIYDYTTTVNPETGKEQLIVLPSAVPYMEDAFAIVDWTQVNSGYSMTGRTEDYMIVSNDAYDRNVYDVLLDEIKNVSDLQQAGEENINRLVGLASDETGKALNVDSINSGILETYTTKFVKSYDVPQTEDGFCIATDIDNHRTLTNAGFETRKEAITPFVYFGGKKVGTVVMFDSEGSPYILDLSGNKRYISFESQEGGN